MAKREVKISNPCKQRIISNSITTPSKTLFNNRLLSTMAPILLLHLLSLSVSVHSSNHTNSCRSFCGNLTIDYPFALQPGCGHQGFRDLLFCINDVVMLHISSGSYRVLNIDYAYHSLILHDPHMSTCDSIVLGRRGNGFVVEPWRAPYLSPTPDNVFMLLGCSSQSPLFQGFPGKHMPCRNVSGLGCDEYYNCPAWDIINPRRDGPVYGSGPPDCCSMPYESVRNVNLSRLDCEGYSSAYSVAPLKVSGPGEWAYGIQVKYSVQGNEVSCRACEATGGSCGFDVVKNQDLCMCGSWNSTSNCDSVQSESSGATSRRKWCSGLAGLFISTIMWWSCIKFQ